MISNTRKDKVIQIARNGILTDVTIPWWVIDPETEERKKKLLESQFFILRQGELGELFRCSRCNNKHVFFTLMCIERPFDGLREGLQAYFYHAGKHGAENLLSEVELQRYEAIRNVLSKTMPDFADMHPQTARQLRTAAQDFDVGAVSLGLLEPITRRKAEALAWNINARGIKPPFRLAGLERVNA